MREEVHESARKHGVVDHDIDHAIKHALAIEDAGEDPDRWLVIGPDRAGNLLEVVVITTVEGASSRSTQWRCVPSSGGCWKDE
jgi:uncharacterized DUF497 family protein